MTQVKPVFWTTHSIFMILGLISFFTGCFIAKFLRTKTWWLKRHHLLEILGTSLIIIALVIAIVMVAIAATMHFRVPHGYLGIATFSLYLITIITGLKKIRIKAEIIRIFHKWMGRIASILMVFTIISGFLTAGIL